MKDKNIVNLFIVRKGLYTDTSSCVRINNTLSDWFTISSGVRQGCVAAPDLFNCIIDYLMENVSATLPGIQLGPYHLTDLEYADDAALFATNQNDISSALAIFDTEACKLGFRSSWAKTKIMKFGDAPSPPSLHICNNDVEFVDKLTYLGSIITNTGDLQPDIKRRIGLATGVMRSLRKPLWRHSSISLETKLRVYQASLLSVLLYGSECWPISTSLCGRLSAFDMQAQQTITDTKWFEYKTNIEVRTLTNRQPIQRYIAQGRLRWLGHLLRSPPNHPALAIYTFNPRAAGWSRPRGAPRTRWSDVLGKDLKQLGTTLMEASNIALDRSRWRSTIVARAVSTPSWQEP